MPAHSTEQQQERPLFPATGSSRSRQQRHTDPAIIRALPYSRVKEFPRDQVISLVHDIGDNLCFIRRGAIEVSYEKNAQKNVAALITSGHFLGEIGFFDPGTRTRQLRTLETTELNIFQQEDLHRLEQQEPEVYCRFLTLLTRSICARFRRILTERQLPTTYGAPLAANRKHYTSCRQPLADQFLLSSQWRQAHRIVEEFKLVFFNISHDLQKIDDDTIPASIQEASDNAIGRLSDQLAGLEADLKKSPYEEMAWGYIFKETFPFLMRSRYGERIYYKPKGYAGDFLMIEHLYRNQAAGDGKIGRMIDQSMLRAPASRAVRGRRRLLTELLHSYTATFLQNAEPIRIMNLACGANRELFDFLASCAYTGRIEAVGIDMDTDALNFTNSHVNIFAHEAAIRLVADNVVKWALGRNRHTYRAQHIIYSAGLIDYLDDRLLLRLIDRCYEQLAPKGYLILGNFSPVNPNRQIMDYLFQWQLIYRDDTALRSLFSQSCFPEPIDILREEQGINLFAVAQKP